MSSLHTPAETYEAFMVPYRFRPWAAELLDRAGLAQGMRVLDVACGTGIVARTAAERMHGSGTVAALDMNPAMIEVGKRAALHQNLEIDWQVGNADSLPYPDRSFDLVTIQQGLQFFPDKLAALRECFRVLAPGGSLCIGIWAALEKQGIQRDYAEAIERVTGSPSMHAPYGAVTVETLGSLLNGAGFTNISIEEVTITVTFADPDRFVRLMVEGTSAGVPTMHGRSDAERAELTAAVETDMRTAVARHTVAGQIVSRSTSHIVLAHVA